MAVRLAVFVSVLSILLFPAPVPAQYFDSPGPYVSPGMSSVFGPGSDQTAALVPSGIPSRQAPYLTVGLRKYINSFTSKQFPDSPSSDNKNDPLSRLEFPWEQTFGVIKLGGYYNGIQVNFEGASTLFTYSGLKEQDSDWFDWNNPGQKIVFSEAQDFPRCWTFDTSVGYTMPCFPIVQWVLGYRAQQFRFTNTDGMQHSIWPEYDWGVLPGEGTNFSQFYKIPYFGGALYSQLPYNFVLRLGGDVGMVTGNSVDYHVRRIPAPRLDYETTSGICWHLNLAVEYRLRTFASASMAGDLISISTRGGHRLTQPGTDQSWDGSRVWSEQKFVEINVSIFY